MGMHELDRSLAFTALLDLSPAFRDHDSRDTTVITRLLDAYYEWLDDGRPFVAGRDDIYTYTRQWLRDNPNL